MIRSKVKRNQTVFRQGDHLYWRTHGSLEKWRQGKVLAVDGKVMWIRAGSQILNLNLSLEPEEDLNFLTLPDKIMAMVGPCLVRKGPLLR